MKHSEFGHLAANVWVRCSDFSKLRVYAVYSNRHPPSLFGEQCEILRLRTLRKSLKRWCGRLEKRRVAIESSGNETGYETGGPGGTGDETGDKTAATAGNERDGGDQWGNVYGRRGFRFWWGRDGSAWRAAFSYGIVSRFRVLAGLRRLPYEWAGRKSQWRRRQWIVSGHRVGWWCRRDGSSEWCSGSCSIPDEP